MVRSLLPLCLLAVAASAQQPWQQLQSPTAAQVLAAWQTPPPEYGPEPYYGLNGPVTLEVVRRDLDNMQRLGYTAVTMQAGYGMPFAYLSPEYFAFIKQFVAEVKQRNMRLWIVDDAGYPSGFAGGKFTTEHPELRMQALVAKAVAGTGVDQPVPANFVAATAFSNTTTAHSTRGESYFIPVVNGVMRGNPQAGDWTTYLVTHEFRTSPTRSDTNPKRGKDGSQSLEDYLDPAATRQYLTFTHEAYKAAVGDEFGKTILGFRGDEPDYSIAGLPWTPAFFAAFQQQKSYDIRPYLAAFLQPREAVLTPDQLRAKADYYDVFANLFRDGFFKPQADWCAANHLEYQVHLNHEELQLQLARSEGDFFRDMRYVQVPGIDSIWHQIWTDTISDFPRLASSAAHVYGHPRAFTESFAAYRPAPDVTMARYVINEQFVRGINQIETMYYPATSTPRKVAPGPNGGSPYMQDPAYPALLAYTRRMSYLMAQGRPAATVALVLPSSSLWLGSTVTDDTFVSAERLLSEHQIDFDIVPEDFLAADHIGCSTCRFYNPPGAFKTASGNAYTTVILPHPQMIGQVTLNRLQAFAKAGGHVLFLGGTPAQIAGKNAEVIDGIPLSHGDTTFLNAHPAQAKDFAFAEISLEQLAPTPTPPAQPPAAPPAEQIVSASLLAALHQATPNQDLTLNTPDTALRYTHRALDGATIFLLFNESARPLKNSVHLVAPGSTVELWDPVTATATKVQAQSTATGPAVPISLAAYATMILVVR